MSMLGLTLKAFFARRVPPRVLVAIAALRGDSIVSDVHIDTDGVIVQDSGRLHVHESTCGGMRIASTSVTVTGQIQIVGDQGAVKHDVDHWWTCECKGCRGIVSIASDGRDVTEVSRFWRVLGDRPTTMWDAAQRWAQLLRRKRRHSRRGARHRRVQGHGDPMTTRPFPCARCGGTAEHTPTTFDADRQPTWWTPEQTIGGAAVCARCFIASFDNEEKK